MATAAKHMTKAEMKTFLEEYKAAWNAHDIEAIMAKLADDVVWAEPSLPAPLHGKAAARQDLQSTFEAFPDLHLPVEDLEVYLSERPDRAVTSWTLTGTMTGRMSPGYEPTGKAARIKGTSVYRFKDGLISEQAIIFDALDFLTQIGLMPKQQGPAFRVTMAAQNLLVRAGRLARR